MRERKEERGSEMRRRNKGMREREGGNWMNDRTGETKKDLGVLKESWG